MAKARDCPDRSAGGSACPFGDPRECPESAAYALGKAEARVAELEEELDRERVRREEADTLLGLAERNGLKAAVEWCRQDHRIPTCRACGHEEGCTKVLVLWGIATYWAAHPDAPAEAE